MLKVMYDESVNVVFIQLREGDYSESDEVAQGIIVDFDQQGRPMAIEILNASSLLGQVDRVMLEYARMPTAA